ncbi:MAG: DUF2399 domain-containing protein [Acidimicrobiia bacterium]|nr:DUF2399 domain-containing protein [Acidimicrobiia bacterium]
MSRWPSLTDGALDEVWARVRERLERRGAENRGWVRLPALSSGGRLALGALLGRSLGATVPLGALEEALVSLGVGADLPAALAALGHPMSTAPAARRAERAGARVAKEAAKAEAATWPEPWAVSWAEEVVRSGALGGLDRAAAVRLVRSVRTVLDRLAAADAPVSRADLAAEVLGSSHALDRGTRLEAAVTKALVARGGSAGAGDVLESAGGRSGQAAGREAWRRAGAHLGQVSAPALVWNLRVEGGLGRLCAVATELGVPVHLSQLALRAHPVAAPGAEVLVVENPRVAEAAAQAGSWRAVVATNGNPSGAVQLLVSQLVGSGAGLRYHGDFDAAGLAICGRMASAGCVPWQMGSADYLAAVAVAERDGVVLPVDDRPAPPTPWDPALRDAFDRCRRIVHEERLLGDLLA